MAGASDVIKVMLEPIFSLAGGSDVIKVMLEPIFSLAGAIDVIKEVPLQGDQMGLLKNRPKCSPTHVLSKINTESCKIRNPKCGLLK
jgi:hypothetical protein